MSNSKGFTLIEAVVAVLVGATVVIAIGGLSERLAHHRTTTDSNSAAMTIAERTAEYLLALPNPTARTELQAGSHGPTGCGALPCLVDLTGASNANGSYLLQWTVADSATSGSTFLITPTASDVKKITVSVTHKSNLFVAASIITYYNVH